MRASKLDVRAGVCAPMLGPGPRTGGGSGGAGGLPTNVVGPT